MACIECINILKCVKSRFQKLSSFNQVSKSLWFKNRLKLDKKIGFKKKFNSKK